MGWAKPQVEKLQKGETVSFRPTGNSMTPKINSGELVTVSPDISDIKKGISSSVSAADDTSATSSRPSKASDTRSATITGTSTVGSARTASSGRSSG